MSVSGVVDAASKVSAEKAFSTACGLYGACGGAAATAAIVSPIAVLMLAMGVGGNGKMIKGVVPSVILGTVGSVILGGVVGGVAGLCSTPLILKMMELFLGSMAAKTA